jgi:hypothetical protein
MNKKFLFVLSFVFALALDFFFWPFVSAQQGTIPPDGHIYVSQVRWDYLPPTIYSGTAVSVTLTPGEVPWHKDIVSTTATTPDYQYAVKVYSNVEISPTQNFQLSSEVFVLHNVQDAIDGYASLQLSEGVTQTLPVFADEALLTTISKNGYVKGILKFRSANVVCVVTSQGLDGIYSEKFLMDAATLVRNKIK